MEMNRTTLRGTSSGAEYPRSRTCAVQQYELRMQLVDPSHRLLLIDFWDPELADQLENVRRDRGGWAAGDIAEFTVRYRETNFMNLSVELEILDRETGRRLRQDGSTSDDILIVLRSKL